MNDVLKRALIFTLHWEGGYVNNPNDSGGATNQGVTQRTYDNYRDTHGIPRRSVKQIEGAEVEDVYKSMYWDKINGDSLPENVAIVAFDWAVNSGVSRVSSYLAANGYDAAMLLRKRESFLKVIGAGHNAGFLKGWLNRCQALREYLRLGA